MDTRQPCMLLVYQCASAAKRHRAEERFENQRYRMLGRRSKTRARREDHEWGEL